MKTKTKEQLLESIGEEVFADNVFDNPTEHIIEHTQNGLDFIQFALGGMALDSNDLPKRQLENVSSLMGLLNGLQKAALS